MLYLAKLLPVFFLPSGATVLLLLASLVFRKRALAVAAFLVLWLSSTPVVGDAVMRAAEGWQTRIPVASVPEARAIVVLSGVLRQTPGAPSGGEWREEVDRVDAGVALLVAAKAPVLIFTDGWLPWDSDAQPVGNGVVERAVALGAPRDRILVTDRVRNTADEAREVGKLLQSLRDGHDRDAVILVTSAYHMRRSRLLFARAGVSVVPFPTDFQTSPGPFRFMDILPHAGSIENTDAAMRELYGYLFYRLIKTT
jgi:uncharacterized SAM-binding protein YcdF (DUF218 family)